MASGYKYKNKNGDEMVVRSIHLNKKSYNDFLNKYHFLFNEFVRGCLDKAVKDDNFFLSAIQYRSE